jgi:hypothetical protein
MRYKSQREIGLLLRGEQLIREYSELYLPELFLSKAESGRNIRSWRRITIGRTNKMDWK